jgi:hypothetical protein
MTLRPFPICTALALLPILSALLPWCEVDMPRFAPTQATPHLLRSDRVIRLDVEYDDHLADLHGSNVRAFIAEAIAIHNIEWRRYRNDWFELGDLRMRNSGRERDASHVLARFMRRTVERPDTVHVNIVGRQLEVFTHGVMPIGGLAYRRSDALVISSPRGVTADLLGYYLFHELGHCWEAFDLPFPGGNSTFGHKTAATFYIDVGNEEIIESSTGPAPRKTAGLAPAIVAQNLAAAREVTADRVLQERLEDLILHEPSPANPSYMRKKNEILDVAGKDSERIAALIERREKGSRDARTCDNLRETIASHYWQAGGALGNDDRVAAGEQLTRIRELQAEMPDLHMLVGAVERKVRRARR